MSYPVDLNNTRQDAIVEQDNGLNPENTVGFETWMPPRKRAKTKEEKEIRKIQRILRNRKAAQKSRDRKRNYVVTLEKKCSVMKQIVDELQSKIDIKSLLSDKGMWDNYLQLEQDTDLSSSTPAANTSSFTGNTDSSSTLAASWAAEVEASIRGKDNKSNTKVSFGEKKQIRVKSEDNGIQSTPARSTEQLTPVTSGYSAQSISPYVSSSDCESDGSKKSVVEATPVSLATSTPNKYDFKPTQGQTVSQALMQGLFNPSEWQSTHLNSEIYQPFILGDFESTKTSEDSFEINNQYEFDHHNPQINALHQPNHSINSLFVEDIGRNPEQITDLAMDISTYEEDELLCTHSEVDIDYELNLKMVSDDFLL
ncbi:Transcriptional activator HAC1 [Nakaseomyces bracarensis]|uniref:Transcriptional activator HAC1 n=1 Tax=Nakaseomyces bracarensis TaxID=273131 RepID=A0ABR4NPE4_9SACH